MSATHEDHGDSHAHHGPPPPPEPKTPMWLPALGAFLFLSAGLYWGLTPSKDAAAGGSPSTTATAPAAADAGAKPPSGLNHPAIRDAPNLRLGQPAGGH